MSSPARIVCIPSADTSFAEEVRSVADRIPGGLALPDALAWFTAELHRIRPGTTIREQDPLARVAGEPPTWYVTRRRHSFRIDTDVWVPVPASEAYRLYVERMADWQTSVRLTLRRPGQPVVGAEYDAVYRFVGLQYTGRFRILAADPGRSVSIEASGSGITVWYVTSFRAEGVGTRVKVKGDYEVPENVFARIADRLVLERTIGHDIDRANASYQALCAAVAAEGVAADAAEAAVSGEPEGSS